MHQQLKLQNDPDLIKLLKASNVAYGRAKSNEFKVSYGLIFLSIAYPIAYIFIQEESIKHMLFILSFLITVFIWMVTDYLKGNTSKGALFKEKFDTTIFQLPWKFMLPEPSMIEVSRLAKHYKRKDIKDWYSANISEKIPDNTVIALCQRINSSWDMELRKKYRRLIFTVLSAYTVSVILLWTIRSIEGGTIFSIYFSTLSFYTHFITIYRGNSFAIKKQRLIIAKLDPYIDKKKKITKKELRAVQDEIYNVRQEPSKVPNTFFRLYNEELKEEFEEYIREINLKYS